MSTNYVAPGQMRNLRACMICSFVQTMQVRPRQIVFFFLPFVPLTRPLSVLRQKFKASGCPNCEPVLQNFGPEAIEDTTSPVFEGLIALREPTKSWVGRWQRVDGFVRGVYAVKVSGNVRFLLALCAESFVCRVALCAGSLVCWVAVCWVALCAGSLVVPGRSVCRIANWFDRSAARGDFEGAGEQRHRLPATRRQLCDGRLRPKCLFVIKRDGVCMAVCCKIHRKLIHLTSE